MIMLSNTPREASAGAIVAVIVSLSSRTFPYESLASIVHTVGPPPATRSLLDSASMLAVCCESRSAGMTTTSKGLPGMFSPLSLTAKR